MARRSNPLPNSPLLYAFLVLSLGMSLMIWAMMETPRTTTASVADKTDSFAEEAAAPTETPAPPIFAPELDPSLAAEWLRASAEMAERMLERGMRSLPIFSARDGVKPSIQAKREEPPEELPPPLPALIEREEKIGPVDELPRRLPGNATPAYPVAALASGLTGKVILRATIDSEGDVKELAVSMSGGADFDAGALAAVRTWKFAPARRGGIAVPCDILVPVEFRIRQ